MSGTLTKCLSPVCSGVGGAATPASSRAPPGPSRGRSHPIPDPKCPHGSQPPMLETAVLKRPFPLKLCRGHFENPQLQSQKEWPQLQQVRTPMKLNLMSTRATKIPWLCLYSPNMPAHVTYKIKGLEIYPCPFHF